MATPSAVGGLRTGAKINGVVIAVTASGCRIFKPPTSKGAHKAWDDCLCDSAAVVKTEGRGYSLVGLFGDGNARAFSIPALRDIGCTKIGHIADIRRLSEACITPTGNVMTWVGPSEVGLFNVWGGGNVLYVSLINLPRHSANANPTHTDILQTTSFTTQQLWFPRVLPSRTCNGSPVHNISRRLIWTF